MNMKLKIALMLASTILPMAGAQQLKPYGVDGVTSAAGILIYKGKSYVSLELLKQVGATLTDKKLFVYTQSAPAGPPLKLSGCLGEKLYNGAFYLTFQAPQLLAADGPGASAVWRIPILAQPIQDLRIENDALAVRTDIDLNEALLIYKDGSRFMQKTMPIGTATSRAGLGYFPAKRLTQGSLYFNKDENETEANPPVKLILPQATVSFTGTFPGMTVDLTCTK